MKISAPEDLVSGTTDIETSSTVQDKEVRKTFQDEVQEILKLDNIPQKFVVDRANSLDSEFKLRLLRKFTDLCKEEIIPRQLKVGELILAKIEEMQGQLYVHEKQYHHLLATKKKLLETQERLEMTKKEAQDKHQNLNERVNETIQIFQNNFNNKTVAERKMAQDLVNIEKKAENLSVQLVETKTKRNYYTTQVNAQTELTKKHVKPLHLDKDTVSFMKTNLNSMRQNIEGLVHRVKALKKESEEITKPKNLEESFQSLSVQKQTFNLEESYSID